MGCSPGGRKELGTSERLLLGPGLAKKGRAVGSFILEYVFPCCDCLLIKVEHRENEMKTLIHRGGQGQKGDTGLGGTVTSGRTQLFLQSPGPLGPTECGPGGQASADLQMC